jgi:hypothetical protein
VIFQRLSIAAVSGKPWENFQLNHLVFAFLVAARFADPVFSLPPYQFAWDRFRRGVASNLYALGADDKVVQRILRHAKPHVTKERYIKVFDPAVLEAMRRMQATLEELRRGQQKASSFLSVDGKLLKPNAGEVAERLKAAVC